MRKILSVVLKIKSLLVLFNRELKSTNTDIILRLKVLIFAFSDKKSHIFDNFLRKSLVSFAEMRTFALAKTERWRNW